MQAPAKTVTLCGIPFENLSQAEARERIASLLLHRHSATVFTPNPQFLAKAQKDPSLAALLRTADLLLPDGVGLTLAARLCGTPLKARLTGIDTAEWLLSYAAAHELSLFLLGAAPTVADRAAEQLRARFPSLRICGTHHGYFDKTKDSEENKRLLAKLRQTAPDLLFVCFGFPAQERWIAENAHEIPSLRLSMGLGGAFDVWSGKLRRAPRILQRCGLEWLWRALREPRRFPALLGSTAALCRIIVRQNQILHKTENRHP